MLWCLTYCYLSTCLTLFLCFLFTWIFSVFPPTRNSSSSNGARWSPRGCVNCEINSNFSSKMWLGTSILELFRWFSSPINIIFTNFALFSNLFEPETWKLLSYAIYIKFAFIQHITPEQSKLLSVNILVVGKYWC